MEQNPAGPYVLRQTFHAFVNVVRAQVECVLLSLAIFPELWTTARVMVLGHLQCTRLSPDT